MEMLDTVIKKLALIFVLCGAITLVLYYTPVGDLINGKAKEKVEEIKKDAKKKIEAKKEEINKAVEVKKEEVQQEVEKVKDKVETNIEKVEDKVKDLKKIKLRDVIK